MKTQFIIIALFALCLASAVCLAEAEDFPSEQAAKAAATKKFPELEKPGSVFNKTFLERVASQRREFPKSFETPKWPWILAHQVNADLTPNPKEVLFVGRGTLLWGPEGARVPTGSNVSFTNFSEKRTVTARIKTTFEDGTSEEKDYTIEPHGMQSFSYKVFRKPVRDAEIVSAQFK